LKTFKHKPAEASFLEEKGFDKNYCSVYNWGKFFTPLGKFMGYIAAALLNKAAAIYI